MGGIFISYRRGDSAAWAGRIWEHLTGAFGPERVFMDVDSINLGEDFLDVIERYIDLIDVMLVIIGQRSVDAADAQGRRRLDLDGDFVAIEVGRALERGCRVVPLLVDQASMPEAEELPPRLSVLARRHAVDVSHAAFARDMERLISSLTPLLTEPGPAVDDHAKPWVVAEPEPRTHPGRRNPTGARLSARSGPREPEPEPGPEPESSEPEPEPEPEPAPRARARTGD